MKVSKVGSFGSSLAGSVDNWALARAGLEHRIDIYRDIEVEDPAVQKMLGRPHRVRVRIRITAQSLLFEDRSEVAANDTGGLLRKKQEA